MLFPTPGAPMRLSTTIPTISLTIALTLQTFSQQSTPLEVIVASPKGATSTIDQSQMIFVSFNQAMVPLKEVPQDEDTGPMLIEPKIKGKYRWMGTRTLAFIPADTLPFATKYTITVPPGTKSLSGDILQGEFHWDFETPRPRVISMLPYNGQRFVELDHAIRIQLNQPVNPDIASRFISIEEHSSAGTAYPTYSARWPTEEEEKPSDEMRRWRFQIQLPREYTLVLTPKVPLRKAAAYTVRCKKDLPGVQGSLGMAGEFLFSFSTFNELSFVRVKNEDRFNPAQSLVLIFSNPVPVKEVAKLIVFDPPVVVDLNQYGWDYQGEEVSIQLPLIPEQQYTGMIKAGLKDRFGNEIKQDTRFTFRTGSFAPYVRMTTGPGVIEAYESHRYPVSFMNIDSVHLQMGNVPPDRIVPLMRRMDFSYYQQLAEEEGILENQESKSEHQSEFSISKMWRIGGTRNKQSVRPIELDDVLGEASRGVALVQVDNLLSDPHHRFYKTVVQVTNIGITAKFAPGTSLVWATNLKDASPIGNADVELRSDSNEVVWTGKTDEKGLAKGPGWGSVGLRSNDEWRQPRLWVIVKSREDVAFSSSDWQEGIEPWQFGLVQDWNPRLEPMLGSLMTDRGLYKAGEQVEIKGVVRVRKQGVWRIPGKIDLRLLIHDPRNEEIMTAYPRINPYGSFATTLPLKSGTPLGYYSMSVESKEMVKGKETWTGIGSETFRVEAFRPAEFEVIAQSQEKSYIVGDRFKGFLGARYLFGAALKNEPVTWRVSVTNTSWQPEGFDGYYFGPMYWLSRYSGRSGYRLLVSKQEKLDEKGGIEVSTDLKVGEITGTASLLFEGDVTSPARQQISGRTSVIIHGGEYYIGIAPSTTFIQTDSTLTYRLVAVTPGSKSVSGTSLTVKIIQRIWRSVRKAESGGRYAWMSEEDNVVVDSSVVLSGDNPIELTFKTKQAGFYYIEAEGKDKRGNSILTDAYFYVSGSGYVPWERSNDDRIELVADKTNFAPGETAKVLVKSPYEQANALISIEREGIIQHYAIKLVGSAPQINIPVLKDYLPNVFVSVVLLQGRTAEAGKTKESDVGRPSFKVGYVKLSVSSKERELSLSVNTDKKDFRPGDSVEVTLAVKDAIGNGVAAELTVSVADLGVLNLTGYRLPRLFNEFYAERPLAVKTTETRMHLVEQREYGEKGEDEGGGGAEEKMMAGVDAEGIRKDFRATAYWNPSIITDSKGEARLKFKLPDNLTSFEVMAVGHTLNSEFGYGENSFTVSKPLLLQPSFPRFARVGDRFEGGVVMVNYSSKEKRVSLTTRTSGVRFEGSDSSFFVLKPGQSLEVRNKYASGRVGKATFVFKAKTDDDADGLQWTIPINVPRIRESVALYESTTDSLTREKLVVPKNIYADLGEVELTAASTAMVGLSGGISYLFTYPYGCLEQRLSAVLPIILAKDLVEAFKLEVYKDKDYRQVVEKALDELPAFQRWNGGFSYWKNTQDTWPYISAYAVYTMVQAKRSGYRVNQNQMQSGMNYLRRVLDGSESCKYYSESASRCTRALILYTFALAGKPDYGLMEKLFGERSKAPLFAKAYLLRALFAAKGNAAMMQELARDLTNQAKVAPASAHFEERNDQGMDWIFNSNVRTTALTMQALVETQPENAILPKVVRWLLEKRERGCWRTTQENLYVVDALATYFKTYEKDEPDFRVEIDLAGRTALKDMFEGRSFKTITARQSWTGLDEGKEYNVEMKKGGNGRLYYGVRMNYYPKATSNAREEGFSIVKTVEQVTGVQGKADTFAAGSMIRVTISVVTNQERHFVVVDDPLPAGFEAVNSSFLTTASNVNEYRQQGQRDWWEFDPFDHVEMKDDRVLLFGDYLPAGIHSYTYLARATSLGTFHVSSTRVEGMYEPEVFGQTGERIMTIQ